MTTNTKALEVLRECPWCSARPNRHVEAVPAKDQFPDRSRPVLKCPNGHARLAGNARFDVGHDDWTALESRWNTRQDTNLARMREALEKAEAAMAVVVEGSPMGNVRGANTCKHQRYSWEGCENCTDDVLAPALETARQALAERGRG